MREDADLIDGRTLLVVSQWCHRMLDPDCDIVEIESTPDERKELRSALENVKYAMGFRAYRVRVDSEYKERNAT